MKRDMDLARAILLKLEENEKSTGPGFVQGLQVGEHSPQEISYHVMLLKEAGLIDAIDMTNSRDGLVWLPKRLTWSGHEFLEGTRRESLWAKAKGVVMEKTGGLSFEILKAVLAKLALDAATGQN